MILVTGGTGFVGAELVRQLTATGHSVRVVARHPERAAELALQTGCEVVAGDVLDPETLRPAMQGVTAVIHLVGIILETPTVSFEQAHRDGTANVLQAATAAGVRRFLQMSALGTRPGAASRYHRSKWEAEELVRRSGLDWTILRPSLIYGPGDKSLNVMSAWMRWPRDVVNFYGFPNLGGGRSLVQPVAVEDVAAAFVRALSNDVAVGKTYDVCGPKSILWRDVLVELARREGQSPCFDDASLFYTIRGGLWTLVMGLPFLLLLCWSFHFLSASDSVVVLMIWVGLLVVATSWKQFLLFNVPWAMLHTLAWMAEKILPRWLHIGEQLTMIAEDNVGNPVPIQQELHLTFRSFTGGDASATGEDSCR